MRIVTLATAATLAALISGSTPGAAAPRDRAEAAQSSAGAAPQSRPRRARPRIRVTPRRYYDRHFSSPYPLPYDIEYPGPNAVRDCRTRLVQEARPSGVVVVPRTRCRWVR